MQEKMLNATEVCVLVGVSFATLNYWYKWRKENPEHELAKILPDYIQEGERQQRLWKASDISRIQKFKESIPHGRNGLMGSVTSGYWRKKDEK